jgi:chemotaxis protein methyltransferase CheR
MTSLVDSARQVLERSVGLRLDPAQRQRLAFVLLSLAEERGVPANLIVDEIAAEGPALQSVLDELTVQETSFFRDRGQFQAFRHAVLPTLRPPLVIWSAGCAWGHEPYTLAMILAEAEFPEWQVVATDISSRALRATQAARYQERGLSGLTEAERSRYLTRVGEDQWEVIPQLRRHVSVQRHNLVGDPLAPGTRGAAVVFCRNVLIYLERARVLTALDGIASAMDPAGWLFLGYSESLWQVTERFRLFRVGEAFAYRLGGSAARKISPVGEAPVSSSSPPHPLAASAPAGKAAAASGTAASSASVGGAGGEPSVAALLAEGEADLEAGDPAAAVRALRKAVYLDPDQGVAQFQLGLAFEMLGDIGGARRAFSAARAALGRSSAAVEAALEGYQISELTRLLDRRLARAPR